MEDFCHMVKAMHHTKKAAEAMGAISIDSVQGKAMVERVLRVAQAELTNALRSVDALLVGGRK